MTAKITRFAPSPTGNLHIGSARTALINFIVSKQNANSKFYLRIEDTDRKRSNSKFKDNIINGLKWLGINWEDEIQIQSNRIKINYNKLIKLDNLIIERHILLLVKFLKNKKNQTKSSKINNFINLMKKSNFKIFNLSGVIIQKNSDFLVFSQK